MLCLKHELHTYIILLPIFHNRLKVHFKYLISKHVLHTYGILLPIFHNRLKVYFEYLIFKTFAACLQYASLVHSYCLTEYTFSIPKMAVYLKYMSEESEMSTT